MVNKVYDAITLKYPNIVRDEVLNLGNLNNHEAMFKVLRVSLYAWIQLYLVCHYHIITIHT